MLRLLVTKISVHMTTIGYMLELLQLHINFTSEEKLEHLPSDLTMVENKETELELPTTDKLLVK